MSHNSPLPGEQNGIGDNEGMGQINYMLHTEPNADAQCGELERGQKERFRKVKLLHGEHVRIVLKKMRGGASLVGVTVIYDTDVISNLLIDVEPDTV